MAQWFPSNREFYRNMLYTVRNTGTTDQASTYVTTNNWVNKYFFTWGTTSATVDTRYTFDQTWTTSDWIRTPEPLVDAWRPFEPEQAAAGPVMLIRTGIDIAEQQREQAEEIARRAEAQMQARRLAEQKALQLLRENITPEQWRQLEAHGFFEVLGLKTGNRYRIKKGFAGNVVKLTPKGEPEVQYCIHPDMRVPDQDAMLAQKLLLECNEELFLKTANATRLRAAA